MLELRCCYMLAVCKTWACVRLCLPGLLCAHALFWCVEQLALNWGMRGESDTPLPSCGNLTAELLQLGTRCLLKRPPFWG